MTAAYFETRKKYEWEKSEGKLGNNEDLRGRKRVNFGVSLRDNMAENGSAARLRG